MLYLSLFHWVTTTCLEISCSDKYNEKGQEDGVNAASEENKKQRYEEDKGRLPEGAVFSVTTAMRRGLGGERPAGPQHSRKASAAERGRGGTGDKMSKRWSGVII